MKIGDPVMLVVLAALGLMAMLVVWWRGRGNSPQRSGVGRLPHGGGLPGSWRVKGLFIAAGVCIVLAGGDLRWVLPVRPEVVVMVDLSPSTRGATYREPGRLEERIGELVGTRKVRVVYFADGNVEGGVERWTGRRVEGEAGSLGERERMGRGSGAGELEEMGAGRTVYRPPVGAGAVILFSDGQFELPPVSPPVFAVIDPGLLGVRDSAVSELGIDGVRVSAEFKIGAKGRKVRWAGVEGAGDKAWADALLVPPGRRIAVGLDGKARAVEVALDGGDRWPENDAMRLNVLPREAVPWWVGARGAPAGSVGVSAEALAGEPSAYLGASAVVLDNVPIESLSEAAQRNLDRYVREQGGTLIVLGGDRAFAAGHYGGSVLDGLLPLSSTPPRPTVHWVLLTDASGSMDEPAGKSGRTRWQLARGALVDAIGGLPPEDVVSVGSFARDVRWWVSMEPVAKVRGMKLGEDVRPMGPTNLQAALGDLTRINGAKLAVQVILLTDAQAQIEDVAGLSEKFERAGVTVNAVLMDRGVGAEEIQRLVRQTRGRSAMAERPVDWAGAVNRMMRGAQPDWVQRRGAVVSYRGALAQWARYEMGVWNYTWMKEGATTLGEGEFESEKVVMVAQWQRGMGRVIAAGYEAPMEQVEGLIARYERRPMDGRYAVELQRGEDHWRVVVRMNGQGMKNGEKSGAAGADDAGKLRVVDGAREIEMKAIAPGEFAAAVGFESRPREVRVEADGKVVRWAAVAGSYAAEFAAIGLNEQRLAELAQRSGGAVVGPMQRSEIELPVAYKRVSLRPWLAMAGAVLLGMGMVKKVRRMKDEG